MRKTALSIISILIISSLTLLAKDFYWINPFPTHQDITDSDFLDEQNGWICGGGGIVFYTSNAGNTWIQQATGIGAKLNALDIINENVGFAGGNDGTIIKTTDGGATWFELETETSKEINDIAFFDENTGIYCDDNGIYRSDDGGDSWTLVLDEKITAISVLNKDEAIVSSKRDIYKTENKGVDWSTIESDESELNASASDFYFIDENLGWASAYRSTSIYKTTDGGVNWKKHWTGVSGGFSSPSLLFVYFLNENKGFTGCTKHNIFFTSSDGGENWEEIDLKGNAQLSNMNKFSDDNIFLFGENGEFNHSSDSGSSWENKKSGEFHKAIKRIEAIDDSKAYLLYEGYLFKTTNAGKIWEQLEFENIEMVSYFNFINESVGYILNTDKDIFKTTNGGLDWFGTDFETSSSPYRLEFFTENYGYALYGGLLENSMDATTDGGETWNSVDITGNVRKLFYLNDNHIWMASETGICFSSDMINWEKISEETANGVLFFDENNGFIFGDKGKLMYSEDGGETWTECDQEIESYFSDAVIINDKAFVTGEKGTCVYSNDNGKTWSKYAETHCHQNLIEIASKSEDFILLSGKFPDYFGKINDGAILLSNIAYERPQTEIILDVDDNFDSRESDHSNSSYVFPNPADNYITIPNVLTVAKRGEVAIHNTLGRKIKSLDSNKLLQNSGRINVGYLPSGAYYLRIADGNKVLNIGFIKR